MIQRLSPSREGSVVDASVIVKWILEDESETAEARALLQEAIARDLSLVSPSIWQYEVANTLALAVRRRRVVAADAVTFLAELSEHLLVTLSMAATIPHVLALRFDISAYDAAYVALAANLGLPLWTADRKLYDRVHEAVPVVRWIGDYPGDS